jgi:hypothetical protein
MIDLHKKDAFAFLETLQNESIVLMWFTCCYALVPTY